MKPNATVLILDGGGSSLKAYVRAETGLELKARYEGDFNLQTGKRERIARVISDAIKRFSATEIKIGLAGAISPKEKRWLRERFAPRRVRAMSDLELAFDMHFPKRDGMIAILGTGSIFAAKMGKRIVKIGGYGRLVGDAGSGYAIGRDAALKYLQLLDGFFDDAIFQAAMKRLFRSKADAIRKIYQADFPLQRLAPLALECAESGSAAALEIVESHVASVARYIERLSQMANRALPLRLWGGLLERETIYAKRLREALRKLNLLLEPDGISQTLST